MSGTPWQPKVPRFSPALREGLDWSSGVDRGHPATFLGRQDSKPRTGAGVLPGESGELLSRLLKCWGAVGR